MKILDYLKPVTNSAEDVKLTEIQTKIDEIDNFLYSTFFTFKTLVDDERDSYPKSTEIKVNNKLNEINRTYRVDIINVSADYKREGMTVWSYCGKYLVDVIGEQFHFNFNKKSYKDRARLAYTREKVINAMITALSFLFSKYTEVYAFQIKATFLKLIIDFFEYKTINHLELYSIYSQILNLDLNVIANKIKSLNIQTKVKIQQKRERKPKAELPSKEQFEYWLSTGQYTVTELKDIIARQFHVSTKTVQRKLADYGLTNEKYTTKANKK